MKTKDRPADTLYSFGVHALLSRCKFSATDADLASSGASRNALASLGM